MLLRVVFNNGALSRALNPVDIDSAGLMSFLAKITTRVSAPRPIGGANVDRVDDEFHSLDILQNGLSNLLHVKRADITA